MTYNQQCMSESMHIMNIVCTKYIPYKPVLVLTCNDTEIITCLYFIETGSYFIETGKKRFLYIKHQMRFHMLFSPSITIKTRLFHGLFKLHFLYINHQTRSQKCEYCTEKYKKNIVYKDVYSSIHNLPFGWFCYIRANCIKK